MLASAMRLDISFTESKLSQFVSNPGDDHWYALERVMIHLKGTLSYQIHYARYPMIPVGHNDWIADANEIYAKSGYVLARCI